MQKEILFKILQLDSLIDFLDWTERVKIHLYMEDKMKVTTPRILAAYEWITKSNWDSPSQKYGDDCLQYFYDKSSNQWIQVECYLQFFPEYIIELNQLKI